MYVATRNLAQVSGGERELRTYYLKPFDRACAASNPAIEGGSTALSLMSAYSSYDGVPVISSYREFSTVKVFSLIESCPIDILTEIVRAPTRAEILLLFCGTHMGASSERNGSIRTMSLRMRVRRTCS